MRAEYTVTIADFGDSPKAVKGLPLAEAEAEAWKWAAAGYTVKILTTTAEDIEKTEAYDIYVPHRTLKPLFKGGILGTLTEAEAELARLKALAPMVYGEAYMVKRG